MNRQITVGYIQKLPKFSSMKLVAGQSGLSRPISSCVILDYEFERDARGVAAFQKGQFVITSFLFAKNNEVLIVDAVRRLIESGCSGLAIRNVFSMTIPEGLIQYANSKEFPIFTMLDVGIYFEDVIWTITDLVRRNQSFRSMEPYVDRLLHQSLDQDEVRALTLQINPSFCTEYCAMYFLYKKPFSFDQLVALSDRLKKYIYPSDSLFCYKNGIMIILSQDLFQAASAKELAQEYMEYVGELGADYYVGISRMRHELREMRSALDEAIYAAVFNQNENTPFTAYASLGIYQMLLPFATQPQFESYRKGYTDRLTAYDRENNTKLYATIKQYMLCGGDLAATAAELAQHKNTTRYRIDKASKLFGEDFTQKDAFEKMSIAFKIELCREVVDRYRQLIDIE